MPAFARYIGIDYSGCHLPTGPVIGTEKPMYLRPNRPMTALQLALAASFAGCAPAEPNVLESMSQADISIGEHTFRATRCAGSHQAAEERTAELDLAVRLTGESRLEDRRWQLGSARMLQGHGNAMAQWLPSPVPSLQRCRR